MVHVCENGKAFEIEFVTGEGHTVAVVTLEREDIRAMNRDEILHVRAFDSGIGILNQ